MTVREREALSWSSFYLTTPGGSGYYQTRARTLNIGKAIPANPHIDDTLIFSNTWDDHLVHVAKGLKAIDSNGLTVILE